MNRSSLLTTTLAALCLAAALAGDVRAMEPGLAEMIQNARTPADHEAIARKYDALAAAAKQEAEVHRVMGERYRNLADSPKGSASPLKQSMPAHCQKLVQAYESAAREYAALAAEHRTRAQGAQ
jgi:hypothetical protein